MAQHAAQQQQQQEAPEDITQSVPVPADKIGWVIGKEGSYIKQLEERSKAIVRISDSSSREYGREWKYVQLQGPPRAVDRAKKLLHIRLERLIQRLYSKDGGKLDDEHPPTHTPTPSTPTGAAAAAASDAGAAAGAGEKEEAPVAPAGGGEKEEDEIEESA